MKSIYLKSALKCYSFVVIIGIEIPFFRVSVTIEPGRSLLQFVTTNCLMKMCFCFINVKYPNVLFYYIIVVNKFFPVFKCHSDDSWNFGKTD